MLRFIFCIFILVSLGMSTLTFFPATSIVCCLLAAGVVSGITRFFNADQP